MVRKSELSNATWSEINFSEALWTTPKERMKRRNPHLVFLSRQALDILLDEGAPDKYQTQKVEVLEA